MRRLCTGRVEFVKWLYAMCSRQPLGNPGDVCSPDYSCLDFG